MHSLQIPEDTVLIRVCGCNYLFCVKVKIQEWSVYKKEKELMFSTNVFFGDVLKCNQSQTEL